MAQKDLGIVTAYGYAKQNGYTGTAEGCLPVIATTNGSFWGQRSIVGVIEANGSIVVRNASAVTMASSASDNVGITFIYIAA